jgi:glycosyltransferase involved in cell wall biosynthesis
MQNSITVVIPVYNGASYLAECVESVLAQTQPAADIIMIDDGSDDDTARIAATLDAPLRYKRQTHGGASSARNAGANLVRTEFMAFLDCDDLWLPTKLEMQLAALLQCEGSAMVGCHVEQFVGTELAPIEAAKLRFEANPIPGWSPSTLFLRTRDFERAGLFDEAIEIGEFAEWFARARDIGINPIMLPDVLCRRRLHRDNLGRRRNDKRSHYARALKKVIDRRRGGL